MNIAIIHGYVPPDAPADEQDVLIEVEAVSEALKSLGHFAHAVPVSLNLASFSESLKALKPELAFNLVESIDGRGMFIHLAPSVLDGLGIPYTGSPAEAMFMTSNKVLAKKTMRLSGIPTPDWYVPADKFSAASCPSLGTTYIVKSVWEHASIGLGEDSVIYFGGGDELEKAILAMTIKTRGACFAEEYIEGREFNISLLAGTGRSTGGGPEVLPHAEIIFAGFPEDRPRIVGYRAKWDEASEEYKGTARTFDLPAPDRPLLAELDYISRRCWDAFGIEGYARVDFRVDAQGRPFVLEVNANPCLSPDAGFAAAAARAGLTYKHLIKRVIDGRGKSGTV
ncbi:MAG: D-alanine--D-alanine ligase [Nitrospirota bacterium]